MSRRVHAARLLGLGVPFVIASLLCATFLQAAESARHKATKSVARQILEAAEVKGGLVVHVGCGDARLTEALRASDDLVVHGLDVDADDVQQARAHIKSRGPYGPVSVDRFDGRHLPYIDNLVNLVVAEELGDVPMKEVTRVLAPLGVAYVKQDGEWSKTVKPWPKDIDQWTHYLHGPDNNAVAEDTVVAPPTGLQWVGGPLWSRAHSTLNGTGCMASAQGRIFTIEDRAPIELPLLPGKYTLVARDAFNGIVLWKRPLENWERITHWMKPTPVQLTRRLVAAGDRVYATLGIFAPVTALDAATGEIVKVYEDTEKTQEIICEDGVLYLVTGDPMNPYGLSGQRPGYRPQYAVYGEERYSPRRLPKEDPQFSVVAVDAETGQQLWQKTGDETAGFQATTLAVRGDMLVYQTETNLVRVNRADGKTVWKKSSPVDMDGDFKLGGSSPTVVLTDDVILRADAKNLIAFAAVDGEELWRTSTQATYFSSPDIFVVGDVVWPYPATEGYDLRTGKVVGSRRITRDKPMGHDRCYRNKATVRYMINSRSGGADFSQLGDDFSRAHPWVRGTCSLGIMPCNGLLYASPHACSCVNETKLTGFYALSATAYDKREDNTLEKGPAYEQIRNPHSAIPNSADWPTYRQDAARTGNATTSLAAHVEPLWRAEIPNPTAPVVAAGRVLFADKQAHTLYSLDSADGKTVWTFTAGGRIDSPPTVVGGCVLFGSADGWVYCLCAETGKLAWMFRAAPNDRVAVGFGQVESLWPVHGSALVLGDIVYCVAGRQSFLNGGLFLYGLDVATGHKKYETQIAGPTGEDGESVFHESRGKQIKGNKSDILVSDGELIYLRHMAFHPDLTPAEKGKEHLITVTGFLDDSGHHRSYWTVAPHLFYDTDIGRSVDADLLVLEGKQLFGTRVRASNRGPATFDPRASGFSLFAMSRSEYRPPDVAPRQNPGAKNAKRKQPRAKKQERRRRRRPDPTHSLPYVYNADWQTGVAIRGKALLKAGDVLFLAGTPNEYPDDDIYRAVESRAGGVLAAISAADGKPLNTIRLDSPPVWDGMAAANGRLFLSLAGGCVQCWGTR